MEVKYKFYKNAVTGISFRPVFLNYPGRHEMSVSFQTGFTVETQSPDEKRTNTGIIEVFKEKPCHYSFPFRRSGKLPIHRSSAGLPAATVAGRFAAGQAAFDDGVCTSDARLDRYGAEGTIHGAGAAFHTGIPVADLNFLHGQFQHFMRAYLCTHPAADTFAFIHLQGCHILKVTVFHIKSSRS